MSALDTSTAVDTLSAKVGTAVTKMSETVKGFLVPQYLNPLQCSLNIPNLHLVLYFVIGMIALFVILFLFKSQNMSKISLLLSTTCLCAIFLVSTMLLVNLCVNNYPDVYNYLSIMGAFILTSCTVWMFN